MAAAWHTFTASDTDSFSGSALGCVMPETKRRPLFLFQYIFFGGSTSLQLSKRLCGTTDRLLLLLKIR
ncbi:hypothetical protein PROFUN_02034 [Planoprotostelium fungivorum]|uniref:Uncharacterized protein n=1 Tax=Planoprotostelium fungivorum TaxID=1890364 RepID=A0A2P6NB72_9EUKA|nr:hypothetical protein PROFUN_02034 [Planoprotostelium fungivorum]